MLAWSPITAGLYQSLPPLEIDHHTWDYFPNLYEQCVGFFNVPRNLYVQGFVRQGIWFIVLIQED